MRAAAVVAAVLGSAAAAAGQPPAASPAPPADAAVAVLVAGLGADDYKAREKAGRELEALGDKALPHLRKALAETSSPEVARRLSVLVRRIDYDRLVSPKRVTMAEKARTAKEAFDEIARQTGYRIEFQGDPGATAARHTVGFTDAPFWRAVDTVAELAGCSISSNYEDDTIFVNSYGNGLRTPFVAYAGPFKLAATNIQLNRSVQLAGSDPRGAGFIRPSESVSLNFSIHSEPKNPMLGMGFGAVVVAAEDELGQSMAPPPAGPNQPFGFRQAYYNGGMGNRTYQMSANLGLVRGGRDARTIRTLKAKVGVNLLSGVIPEVTVPDPLKAKSLKATGRTVEVDLTSVTGANNTYSAVMTVRKLAAPDPNNFDGNSWMYSFHQRVELLDAQGNKYRATYANVTNQNPGAVTLTVPFQSMDSQGRQRKLGPPARLVVNEWVMATHEVAFEFRDVPLP